MLKVGLTGGIGSGKSTVAAIFKTLGIPVLDADAATKWLMTEDTQLRQQLIKNFGEQTFINHELNKTFLAEIVFKNKEKLKLLNSLTHPVIIDYTKKWMSLQTSAYCINEAALIFESGANKILDIVIGVSAPLNLRVERIMKRNSLTQEQVMLRINNQFDDEEKMKRCDYVIVNNEREFLVTQVLKIHRSIVGSR